MPGPVAGMFFYLYLIVDIFSRKIVGWQVFDGESAELAGQLLRDICTRQNIRPGQLTVHSDNGAPMKGETMLATISDGDLTLPWLSVQQANVAGRPAMLVRASFMLVALALAANELASRGRAIEAGWIVLTGGITDAVVARPGSTVWTHFATLGSIYLSGGGEATS